MSARQQARVGLAVGMNPQQRRLVIGGLLAVILASVILSYVWVMSIRGVTAPTSISTGPTSHVHTLQVENDGTILLGDQEGLWRAGPGAKNWKPFAAPIDRLMPICLARIGKNVMLVGTTGLSSTAFGAPHGLWRSTDDGKHWKLTTLPDKYVTVLAVNPAVPKAVVALAQPDATTGLGHGGIWASTDNGVHWKRINRPLALKATNGMALLPGNPFTVLWAGTQGIYRSANGGKSWRFQTLGQAQTLSLAVSPLGQQVAYAGAGSLGGQGSGIWVTTDAGAHWRLEWKAPPTPVLAPTGDLYRQVYGYGAADKPFVYLSTAMQNKLVTQTSQGPPPINDQPSIMAGDPSSPGRLYAAYSFPLRIFVSDNYGVSWQKVL